MSYFTMKEAGPEAARTSLTTLSWATPHSANSVGKARKTGRKQPLPERPTWVTQQPRNARRRASVESSCLELQGRFIGTAVSAEEQAKRPGVGGRMREVSMVFKGMTGGWRVCVGGMHFEGWPNITIPGNSDTGIHLNSSVHIIFLQIHWKIYVFFK